jgi:hypothetical protein
VNCQYNMTSHDVREQGKFEDSIGTFPEFIDGYGILILPTTRRYFQIPYRNLLPKNVENLLVSGCSTGGDRDSHAATRNMACCAVTGQGAGIAAALSLSLALLFQRSMLSRFKKNWSGKELDITSDSTNPCCFEGLKNSYSLKMAIYRSRINKAIPIPF